MTRIITSLIGVLMLAACNSSDDAPSLNPVTTVLASPVTVVSGTTYSVVESSDPSGVAAAACPGSYTATGGGCTCDTGLQFGGQVAAGGFVCGCSTGSVTARAMCVIHNTTTVQSARFAAAVAEDLEQLVERYRTSQRNVSR